MALTISASVKIKSPIPGITSSLGPMFSLSAEIQLSTSAALGSLNTLTYCDCRISAFSWAAVFRAPVSSRSGEMVDLVLANRFAYIAIKIARI